MRLLRLISDQVITGTRPSEFENYFQDNIILKAGSKIGLLNASIPVNYKNIEVDQTSNEFQFRTANIHAFYTVVLPSQLYTTQSFIDAFNTQAWKLLKFSSQSNNGFLICLSTTKQNNQDTFAVSSFRCRNEPMVITAPQAVLENITSPDNSYFIRANQGTSDNQSFAYSKLPMLLSCSFLRTQIQLNVRKMIIGITDTFDGTSSDTLADDNLPYAIKIDGAAAVRTYWYRDDRGIYVDSGQNAVVNDIVALDIEQGKLFYRIYTGAAQNTVNNLYNASINQLRVMNFAVGIRESNGQVTTPSVIYDPRYNVTSENHIAFSEISSENIFNIFYDSTVPSPITAPPIPNPNPGNTAFTLNFSSVGFRKILGFNRNTLTTKGVRASFIADMPVNALTIPSNIIVEFQTLKLDCYDGFLSTRRNIVAVMPNVSFQNNHLVYMAVNPVMLTLDTFNDLNLRSLRVRILTRDDEERLLDVDDRIELTFVLE